MAAIKHFLSVVALSLLALVSMFLFVEDLSTIALADTVAVSGQPSTEITRHQEREAFAHHFAQQVLAIIQDPKKSYGDRKTVLREAFSHSVDIDWIAKFVIGNAWNKASDEQKERYVSLYRKFLTETYVSNFAENPDKRIRDIKIFGINEATDSDFTVHTQMQLADQENLNVDYLVREESGKYKVLDIAIENVSLIATHRSQFGGLAVSRGVGSVIAKLEQMLDGDKSVITLSMK